MWPAYFLAHCSCWEIWILLGLQFSASLTENNIYKGIKDGDIVPRVTCNLQGGKGWLDSEMKGPQGHGGAGAGDSWDLYCGPSLLCLPQWCLSGFL